MPYIGNTIRAADDYRLIDDISSGFNGSETSFALQVAGSAPVPFPKSPQQVLISVNGVIQEPDPTGSSGFNLVGTNIVFSSAPTNGHAFFGIIYATADYLNAGGNFPAGSLGAPSITFIGDENTGLFRKSGGSVGFVSDATEIANFDSNGITISSGNIIIPDSIIHGGDSNTKIRFPAADTVSVETGGTERLRIASTGKATFTTPSGDDAFLVKGDSFTAVRVQSARDSDSDHAMFQMLGSRGTNASPTIIQSGDTVGTLSARGYDGNSYASSSSINFGVDGSPGDGDMPGRITFSTSASGSESPTERMRIDSSGNVTVKTDDVAFRGSGTLRINSGSTFGALNLDGGSSNRGGEINLTGGSNGGQIQFRTGIGTGQQTEKMRLDNTGRLLLGTTTEGEVNADDFTIATTANTGVTIRSGTSNFGSIYFSDGTSGTAEYRGIIAYSHSNDFLHVYTAAQERMRINSSGSVLIGATSTVDVASSAAAFLQVEVDSSGIPASFYSTVNGSGPSGVIALGHGRGSVGGALQDNDLLGQIRFAGGDGTDCETQGASINAEVNGTPSSNNMPTDLTFSTNSGSASVTERMRILKDGKVGIGTGSPAAELHVSYSYTAPTGGLDSNNALVLSNTNSGSSVGLSMLSATNSVSFMNFGDTDDGDIGGLAYFNTDNSMTFRTNAAERMRIDSSGRLLVGTTTQFGDGNDRLMIENTTNGGRIAFGTSAGFSECIIGQVSAYWADNKKVAAISFFGGSDTTNKDDGTIRFATSSANNLSECGRFDRNGALNINCTTNPLPSNSDGRVHVIVDQGGDGVNIKHDHVGNCVNLWRTNGDGQLVDFFRGNTSQTAVGTISVNATSTSYGTSSDYRLKENEVAISDGITRLKTLKPYRFNFKIDPSKTVDGFFAHEVTAVPEAVFGTKDATNEDGSVKPQSIDQSKLVPLLVAALQEEIGKREALEVRIAALEAA